MLKLIEATTLYPTVTLILIDSNGVVYENNDFTNGGGLANGT